jgi:hypothetical protein
MTRVHRALWSLLVDAVNGCVLWGLAESANGMKGKDMDDAGALHGLPRLAEQEHFLLT